MKDYCFSFCIINTVCFRESRTTRWSHLSL